MGAEDWTDTQWEAFDHEVIAACRTLLTAFDWRQGADGGGLYKPSSLASKLLDLMEPQGGDADLRHRLTEDETDATR